MRKVFALSSILTLLLTAMPVLATDITTYFYNDGPIAAFHETLWSNYGSEGMTELVYAEDGELMVWKTIETSPHRFDFFGDRYNSANIDTIIEYDPWYRSGYVSVDKGVWWGENGFGGADIYIETYGTKWTDVTHAGGIGAGEFMYNVDSPKGLDMWQSVGLDDWASCDDPHQPYFPEPPVCTWC